MTFHAGARPVCCLHCGSGDLDERVWINNVDGIVLGTSGRIFRRRNSQTSRFLVCAHCGLVAIFTATARRPLTTE